MDYLNELFYYNDGKLFNKKTRCSTALKDNEAGYIRKDGYIGVGIKGKELLAHRIIYYLHYGYMPDIIDHIDRNPKNNKIENLRAANNASNCANGKLRVNNKTGYRGVSKCSTADRYVVMCGTEYIGLFKTAEEAALAYNNAAITKYGEFANLNEI